MLLWGQNDVILVTMQHENDVQLQCQSNRQKMIVITRSKDNVKVTLSSNVILTSKQHSIAAWDTNGLTYNAHRPSANQYVSTVNIKSRQPQIKIWPLDLALIHILASDRVVIFSQPQTRLLNTPTTAVAVVGCSCDEYKS